MRRGDDGRGTDTQSPNKSEKHQPPDIRGQCRAHCRNQKDAGNPDESNFSAKFLSGKPSRYSTDNGPVECHGYQDRKSTRLNSSHVAISYAVFCLKKKKITNKQLNTNNE